jgi:hypothetical protein
VGDRDLHEEQSSMLRWIGESFEPVMFNVVEANERLANI